MIVDRTRVRERTTILDPRITLVGHVFAFHNGQWIRPPLSNEADLYYQVEPWYTLAEKTADESHLGPPYVTGGPFTSIKLKSNVGAPQAVGWYGQDKVIQSVFTGLGSKPYSYRGGFLPIWPSDSSLPILYRNMWDTNTKLKFDSTNLPNVLSWGPTAWSRTAPKIEMANGFVALSETRDLPRMLKQTSKEAHLLWDSILASGGSSITSHAYRKARRERHWKQLPKSASDSFLNQVFGWSPFLSDMRQFYDAYRNTASYMSRMAHGNDKWKVYRRTLQDIHSRTKWMSGTNWCVSPGTNPIQNFTNGKPMQWTIWEEKSTLITSSGRFKWYKPEFETTSAGGFKASGLWDDTMRQMAMYGLRVSPSNVWRATPWTWLIDWGFGVGRNIDRLQEQLLDGVVSQYLYLMRRDVTKLVLEVSIPFTSGTVSMTFDREIDTKQRKEAGSPYGFDSPWDSLTPMRLAILAALGISRKG